MEFLRQDWGGVRWSSWVAFVGGNIQRLPRTPGVYRVRMIGGEELFYIGQTGVNLRDRLNDLITHTTRDPLKMPFNDPHTAAPGLWAWHDAEHFLFECAAAPIALTGDVHRDKKKREAFECYLLWQYRLELGKSTRCNHGHFHPRYSKSTNRKEGKRGRRLYDHEPSNPGAGPCFAPLPFLGCPSDSNWMGLPWCDSFFSLHVNSRRHIPTSPGVYKVFDLDNNELLYIGQSSNLRKRFSQHVNRSWGCIHPGLAFSVMPEDIPDHQLLEIENDLIGGYYQLMLQAPLWQFGEPRSPIVNVPVPLTLWGDEY